jgi:Spy/CpxP family protein refolding chaperone
MVERRLENLTQQLNLTSEQKDKIRPLLKHEMERIREIRSNTNLSQGEARQRMEMVRRITRAHIAEILTPEQKKQFQEMREEHHGEGGPGGGQRGPGSPGGSDTPPSPQDTPNLIR